jgi:hypothetical protein
VAVARIDKKLNLYVPVYGEPLPRTDADGNPVLDPETKLQIVDEPIIAYACSCPISREMFERYFMVIAQTFATIMTPRAAGVVGLGLSTGPGCAALVLKHVAQQQRVWEDDPTTGTVGVRRGLLEEIKRLTTVAALTADGWKPVPLAIAVDQGFINEEDAAEVENAVVFFIAASAMLNRAQRAPMVSAAADLWGALTSSSTPTEFIASLRTSTGTASSGARSPAPAPADSTDAAAETGVKRSSVPA